MENYQKEIALRDEIRELQTAINKIGPNQLSREAKRAATDRIYEITTEIHALNAPEPVVDPLDTMTLEELQLLYDEKSKKYTSYDSKQYVTGARPLRTTNPRLGAELLAIQTRIQKLEDEREAI